MPGNPYYVTQTSAGVGKWNLVDTGITPQQLSWSITSTGTFPTTNIEVTIDNPFAYGSSVTGSLGGLAVPPSSASPTAFVLATYLSSNAASANILTLPSSFTPIYAWRINETSAAGPVAVTFLQAGKKQ